MRLLLVEDSEDDAQLLLLALQRGGLLVESRRVDTAAGLREALGEPWDAVLSDYSMPGFSGTEALDIVRAHDPFLPFIVVSGAIGEEQAVDLIRRGADDYVMKDGLVRLCVALEQSLAKAKAGREREQSRQARDKAEAQLRQLVETAAEGIVHVDLSARIVEINDRAARTVGYSAEELQGVLCADLISESDRDEFARHLQAVLQGRPQRFEQRLIARSGDPLWAAISATPLIEDGMIVGALGMVTDVTERKEAERRLRESETRFFTAFHANPAPATIADLESGQLIEANDAWLQTVGLDREEALGKSLVELGLMSQASRSDLIEVISDAPAERGVEVRLSSRSGRQLTILWNGRIIELDGRRCLLGTGLDITERKVLEESLSVAQFSVDNAAEAIFWFSEDGRILYANAHACALYGYEREELLSMTVFDLDPDRTKESWEELWSRSKRSPFTIEARPRKKSGERFLVEIDTGYLEHGGKEWAFSFGRDITDRRRAEDALRHSEHRFRQMFESISSGVAFYQPIDEGADFLLSEFNPAAERICGLPRSQVVGRRITEVFPGVEALGLLEVLRRVSNTGAAEFLPASPYHDARVHLWVENFVYRLDSGEVCAVFDDVTARQTAFEDLRKAYGRLRMVQSATLQALGAITELRDPYTAGHQRRVAKLATAVGRRLGLSESQLEGLQAAALVHDIGKMAVPFEILSFPAALTTVQMEMVHEHASSGYEILKGIDFDWPVADIVRQHHEHLDGSGYPLGLKGDEIMLEARIIGAADMLEAMASHRPYRPALGITAALQELRAAAGAAYDAAVVEALSEIDIDAELAT